MSDKQEPADTVDMRLAQIKQTGSLPQAFKPNPEFVVASDLRQRFVAVMEQERQKRVLPAGAKASDASDLSRQEVLRLTAIDQVMATPLRIKTEIAMLEAKRIRQYTQFIGFWLYALALAVTAYAIVETAFTITSALALLTVFIVASAIPLFGTTRARDRTQIATAKLDLEVQKRFEKLVEEDHPTSSDRHARNRLAHSGTRRHLPSQQYAKGKPRG